VIQQENEHESKSGVHDSIEEGHEDQFARIWQLRLRCGVGVVVRNWNHTDIVEESKNNDQKGVNGTSGSKNDS
jgi:hypothetical protein